MMNIWDYIPHRLILNYSLDKESKELKEKVDSYRELYNQKIKEIQDDLDTMSAEKDAEFDKTVALLQDELAHYSEFLGTFGQDLQAYVSKTIEWTIMTKQIELIKKQQMYRRDYARFLQSEMSAIGDEVGVLNDRIEIMDSQIKLGDIIKLSHISGSPIAIEDSDDITAITDKIRQKKKAAYDSHSQSEIVALNRLEELMQERSQFLPMIAYVKWVIGRKIRYSKQLKYLKDQVLKEKEQFAEDQKMLCSKAASIFVEREELSRRIRYYWMEPITGFNAEIAYVRVQISELYNKIDYIQKQINEMKEIKSSDQNRWDALHREKQSYADRKNRLRADILDFEAKRSSWYEKRDFIIGLCKKYCCTLMLPDRSMSTDEDRIISDRLGQIEEIRKVAIAEAEKRCHEARTRIAEAYNKRKYQLELDEHDIRFRLTSEMEKLKEFEYRVNNAHKIVALEQKNDHRPWFIRIVSPSDALVKARNILAQRELELKTYRIHVCQTKSKLLEIQKAMSKALSDYSTRINACIPVLDRPNQKELMEERKLQARKQEIYEERRKRQNDESTN